jgi:Tfp pilus assembly protein PilO
MRDVQPGMSLPGENTMIFSKLPKEKRNHLVLVALAALIAVLGLYFGLIQGQNESLARLAQKKLEVQASQRRVLDAVRRASEIDAELASARETLSDAEADVASGDLYSWVINTLRQFKSNYKVNISQLSPISGTSDVSLLSNCPYKQATVSLSGTAHFHDFGRFVADLENQFPHMRVLNLSLELNQSPAADDQETVSFKLDLATLVKTNPS